MFLILGISSPAFGWGCSGHQVVALIALEQLNANAKARAEQLLQGQPIPAIRRFCAATALDPFANLASWADDERDLRKGTAPWHYIDIPLITTRTDFGQCSPAEGCVTSAIRQQLDVLRLPGATTQERANALMFVIHFVGDLHQPLHAATNNDRGGNCVPVRYFKKKPIPTNAAFGNYAPNLHSVWDTDLPERIGKITAVSHDSDVQRFVDQLLVEFAPEMPSWRNAPADLDGWAWESHQIAATVAYGKLPRTITPEAQRTVASCTDDENISARMARLHERLGKAYLRQTSPAIREQFAKAGARLAGLLNQVWP